MRLKEYFPLILATVTLCMTVFFFAPFNTFFINIDEYNFIFPTIMATLLSLSFVVIGLVLLVESVIYKLLLRGKSKALFVPVVATIVAFLAFMFWLQGNFIAPDIGVLDGRRIFWRNFWVPVVVNFVVWLIALGILVYYRRRLFSFVVVVCSILLATQTVNFSFQYFTKPEPSNAKIYMVENSKKYSLSNDKNLVIIMLDTFQSDVFEEIMAQNPEITDKLSGFTYFPDTAGGYPSTSLSMPLIMTGRFYRNQEPIQDFFCKRRIREILSQR